MSGHSHSSNIWSTKSAQDIKRSKVFTRVSKDIFNSVKIGKNTDPSLNPLLRSALDRAKSINMPQDRISKAIDKASGKSDEKDIYQSKIYEVLSNFNKFILIEAETDNPTRTIAEVKLIVSRSGFKMLEVGSAIRFFSEVGEVDLKIIESLEEYIVDKIISINGIIDYIKDLDGFKLSIKKEDFRDSILEISSWENVKITNSRIVLKSNLVNIFSENELHELNEFKNKMGDLQDVVDIWW